MEKYFFQASAEDFKKIPGVSIAYWTSKSIIQSFESGSRLGDHLDTAQGMKTLDNERFIRRWQEVSFSKITKKTVSDKQWVPINHGGGFRKWYGFHESVLKWFNDGEEIKSLAKEKYNSVTRTVTGMGHYFENGITWSAISSDLISVRKFGEGFIFTNAGMCAFGSEKKQDISMALLNSKVGVEVLKILAPSVNFGPNQIGEIRIIDLNESAHIVHINSKKLVVLSSEDWDFYETSWDFTNPPLLKLYHRQHLISATYMRLHSYWRDMTLKMQRLEEENNRIFIDAYGLQEELTPEVASKEITLTCNPYYRYSGNKSEDELSALLQSDTMKELVSYTIGCMMGRYSLDEPGLIYAHSGNEGFDPTRYQKFKADDDGIIPLTDKEWFSDDAANRLEEFIATAWDAAHLEENLGFLADNLSPKKGESSRETIRRYLCDSFYKDHTQTYKKRPIYWLFTSGKQKAFQCLVYLHRYNEGTLARMRTQYVIPLTAKLAAHVNKLEQDKDASTSTPEIKKLEKEIATLHKQQAELSTFDEKLRHYADQRIPLDLDDGVKVNYGKFGDLLADVKAIMGGANE
ncbi:restriction enzyme family protein [Cellvibrio sp. BR]|nr:restriction enzyme family protein [Cellvibrio sp. BR]